MILSMRQQQALVTRFQVCNKTLPCKMTDTTNTEVSLNVPQWQKSALHLAQGIAGACAVLGRMYYASADNFEERAERLALAGKYGSLIWMMYKDECRIQFIDGADATLEDFLARVDAL